MGGESNWKTKAENKEAQARKRKTTSRSQSVMMPCLSTLEHQRIVRAIVHGKGSLATTVLLSFPAGRPTPLEPGVDPEGVSIAARRGPMATGRGFIQQGECPSQQGEGVLQRGRAIERFSSEVD